MMFFALDFCTRTYSLDRQMLYRVDGGARGIYYVLCPRDTQPRTGAATTCSLNERSGM